MLASPYAAPDHKGNLWLSAIFQVSDFFTIGEHRRFQEGMDVSCVRRSRRAAGSTGRVVDGVQKRCASQPDFGVSRIARLRMSPPRITVHRLNDAPPVVLQVRCARADTEGLPSCTSESSPAGEIPGFLVMSNEGS